MQCISRIVLPDDTEYELKDAELREAIDALFENIDSNIINDVQINNYI